MTSLTQIVDTCMYHNSASDDGFGPGERDDFIADVDLTSTIISRYVTQITNMPDSISRSSVVYAFRIEMGAGTCATISVVAKLMYVESMLPCSQPRNLPSNRYCVSI